MDQSPQLVKQFEFYGSSDQTSSVTEIGLRFVDANSKSKSQDLGPIGECCLSLLGCIGTRDGRNSVFVHFRTLRDTTIRLVRRLPLDLSDETLTEVPRMMQLHQATPNHHTAKYIRCGLSDKRGIQLGLDDQGFALGPLLPKGEYYATITTEQCTPIPFHVQLLIGNPLVETERVQITR